MYFLSKVFGFLEMFCGISFSNFFRFVSVYRRILVAYFCGLTDSSINLPSGCRRLRTNQLFSYEAVHLRRAFMDRRSCCSSEVPSSRSAFNLRSIVASFSLEMKPFSFDDGGSSFNVVESQELARFRSEDSEGRNLHRSGIRPGSR
jgi:hypothetical protein